MTRMIVEPTEAAGWHRAVTEAAQQAACPLDPDRESYLVFLLMRYLRRRDIARVVLALAYLRSQQIAGSARREALQEVGDLCLLFTGLFPEQAARRRVRLSYFVDMGRSAYSGVADSLSPRAGALYADLAETFVSLADVLGALRQGEDRGQALGMLDAAERYLQTGSPVARRQLAGYTDATPVPASSRRH